MQLILLSENRGHVGNVRLTSGGVWLSLICLAFVVFAGVFYSGFRAAERFGIASPSAQVQNWRAELAEQEDLLNVTRLATRQNLDALALRLGQMNAHVVRLDALGQRLTHMADLDDGEFDFTSEPSLGGPEEPVAMADPVQAPGILTALDSLSVQLQDRQQQLNVLEDFLLNRRLREEAYPEGRPVTSGYISSSFGNRTDPFTGRAAFHKGIDFAGRAGYCQMLEVNHGNGYVTRYANNSENLVAVGDTVKRGQEIALMGETGRATGPNLHFELLRNGRVVDPLTYI